MMSRRTLGAAIIGGAVAIGTAGSASVEAAQRSPADSVRPPAIATPANAQRVTMTLRLKAKDGEAFAQHLLSVIPVTRTASGCRYSHTFRDPANLAEFLLIQGWDSAEQQQGYIGWRQSTGDLDRFLAFLDQPPVIETFQLLDA
jgi:quinol monooxygenase YgiN